MRLLRGVRDRYEARAMGHPTPWLLLDSISLRTYAKVCGFPQLRRGRIERIMQCRIVSCATVLYDRWYSVSHEYVYCRTLVMSDSTRCILGLCSNEYR